VGSSDIQPDQVFDGRYLVIRKLGTGGMATVYLAEDQELGRRVAIKTLDERHAQDEQFVERFRREAKSAAVLSHPNIVAVYDRGQFDGTYYIAMEYLEGKTLKELLVSRGATPVRIAVDYARQILAALEFAHRNGIVHRDIKPHNVIVAPDGRVKVMDFGIARSGSSQVTEAGSIIGTAQYLSPEQARGAPAGPPADIYSTGIVLYEMLTGSVPFTGDTPLEVAMQHLSAIPEAPSKKRADIPHELDAIVLRALAKDPEQRYKSARDMDADLARFAAGLSVSPATEEAATSVLAGAGAATAATSVIGSSEAPTTYRRSTDRYYDYDRAVRRRPIWPWLLAALLLVAAAFASYYVYDRIADQLGGGDSVSVPFLEGKLQTLAVREIRQAGLVPKVRKRPNETVDVGRVFDQDPAEGEDVDEGSTVVIVVSSGVAKTTVPDVEGDTRDDAVAALTAADLDYSVTEVYSERPVGEVTAQKPVAGTRLAKGETVFINVSRGIKQVSVPGVVGESLDAAIAAIEDAGFTAGSPVFENSDQPENTVIAQDPPANSLQRPGTTIVLTVSKGPAQVLVPDVEGFEVQSARETLRAEGFKVSIVKADTDLIEEDGIVLSQTPTGGSEADPKSTVTLTVGRYVEPPPPPEETFPTDTETTETTETTTTDEESFP
jgi:beta-lactam-binding protein with PASTA domain/predicted Ser/Thr protein kinase